MPSCLLRPGFSFAEVMFAVIVLGVGFIMIAAIFPVAITQTKATKDETSAAANAKAQINQLQDVLSSADVPALTIPPAMTPNLHIYGQVYSIRDPQPGTPATFPLLNSQGAPWVADQLWNKVKGNLISSSDPRFACVVLYRRDRTVNSAGTGFNDSPYVQLYVISTQVRNRSVYDPVTIGKDVATVVATPPVNLQPRPVKVSITPKYTINLPASDPPVDLLAFDTSAAAPAGPNSASADEGTYVIIARDNVLPPNTPGRMNGRIYRLGVRRTDLDNGTPGDTYFPSLNNRNVYELAPGGDFAPDPDPDGTGTQTAITSISAADAFIVGRNTTATVGEFEGPAQDISIYTTFIQPK